MVLRGGIVTPEEITTFAARKAIARFFFVVLQETPPECEVLVGVDSFDIRQDSRLPALS